MKRLIITSDDFGLSSGVNQAVERAFQSGLLTGASIMPGGEAFDEAIEIALRNPALQIGLHLTLLQGQSVLHASQIPGLVDASGSFSDNPVMTGIRYFFDRSLYSQLKLEIEAQIERVLHTGVPLTHIDGHLNIHLHPTLFRILVELMPKYGITTFRLAQERLFHNLRFDRSRILGKLLEKFIFHFLTDSARPELDHMGIGYAAEVKGVLNSGRMTEQYILNIIDGVQEGVTEIYFHPGIMPDEVITRQMPNYLHQEEFAAITSPKVRQKLKELQIQLQNYRGDLKC